MDAGLAALLGTAIGSVASLGAAFVGGRTQAKSQQDQWRRQVRREAYTQYLAALHDRDIAMDDVLRALQPDEPEMASVDEHVQRYIALARTVHRAVEVVMVEGPSTMEEAAHRVGQASAALSEVMQRMVKNAQARDTASKSADSALAAQKSSALWDAEVHFRMAARNVLGNAH
jgi:sugar phosphate isomerase/epimerase